MSRTLERIGRPDLNYDAGTGLLAVTRRYSVKGKYTTVDQLPTAVREDWGTPDEEHTDALLINQYLTGTQEKDGETSVLIRVYQQLPATGFVQAGKDQIDYDFNGLRRTTRSFIGKTGQSISDTIGTSEYNGDALAQMQVKQPNEVVTEITKIYLESGVLSKSESGGPDGLPNTKTHTWVAIGETPSMPGIIISKRETDYEGYKTFAYTSVSRLDGSSPVGVLDEWEDNITVEKPGTISIGTYTDPSNASNALVFLAKTGRTTGRAKAEISVSLTTDKTVTDPSTYAYNLDSIFVSARIISTRKSPVGMEQGESLSIAVYNLRPQVDTPEFRGYYYTGDASKTETWVNPATIVRDDDSIVGETLDETLTTAIELSGASSGPAVTGIFDEQVDPVFKGMDGTQYFRKVTYTIPAS
ncbi:hypothetical protein H5P28_11530 [Ruficoccus amylovorans]|uniref:Uncharacterized protein n=1 Tax=Ruficoccus amylovorans TaxID=1804625 RepID=A0A842HFS3_9BACT|nr:hypothetical protein [Ruficoccus amylovorans]MBC2594888.1 hypothetical protein [Ruficoccus amylovorans]